MRLLSWSEEKSVEWKHLRLFLYDIIAALNNGERNPLKIKSQAVADAALEALQKYGTEEQSNKALAIMGKIFEVTSWQHESFVI